MSEAILDMVHGLMGSPWVYAVLLAFAALDGFFPVVPSESLVITAGVFAAAGEPILLVVIVVAAAGAFLGDHIAYLFGRTAGERLVQRTKPGTKRRAAFDRAGRVLEVRGGLIVVVCRYIPGARTAITMTAGAVRYPLRSFSAFDAIAAVTWAAYSALIGYIGGAAFEDDPLKGLALGLGLALSVTAVVELVRHVRSRPARRRAAESVC
jgi:membrane protein DedA with SNARE-associated domain